MPGPMGGPKRKIGQEVKAKDFKGTTSKLIKNYLAKYRFLLLIVFIFAVGSALFTIVGPNILGNATTEIFNGLVSKLSGGEGINFGKIGQILLTLLGLYVLSAVFSFIQGFTMTNVAQKITFKIRNDIVAKINRLPMRYFDKKTHGEVLSVITNDIDTLSMNLDQSITEIIRTVCLVIGIIVMMLSISWQMTLISFIIIPIAGIMVKNIVAKSQKYFQRQQNYLAEVNGQVEEIYGGLNIVKVFNAENKTKNEFEKANDKLYHAGWKAQFLSGLMYPLMNFISNIGYVGVAVVGGYLAIRGTITVGNIQSFIQYNKQFTNQVGSIAQISGTLQAMAAAAERVFEFLEEPEEQETAKGNIDVENLSGNVEFKDVHFGYDEDRTIINDFNAKIKDGQKIAIVGPTGAGKTTLADIILGLMEPQMGNIYVDGKDIQGHMKTWQKKFGYIPQMIYIMDDTIKNNIILGISEEDLDEGRLWNAIEEAQLLEFIQELEEGIDTVIGENGMRMSGGQRQRIGIARALYHNPEILILDEATSALDSETETAVMNAINKFSGNKTMIIIAHRLTTIKDCDIVYKVDDQKVVETTISI